MKALTKQEAIGSVGPGWATIVSELYDELPEGVFAVQVKEKFGTLRFYEHPFHGIFQKRIREAEQQSAVTCEACGQPGSLRKGRWLKTLCDMDFAKRQ